MRSSFPLDLKLKGSSVAPRIATPTAASGSDRPDPDSDENRGPWQACMSYAEVAKAMNLSVVQIRNIEKRALARFRKRLLAMFPESREWVQKIWWAQDTSDEAGLWT